LGGRLGGGERKWKDTRCLPGKAEKKILFREKREKNNREEKKKLGSESRPN